MELFRRLFYFLDFLRFHYLKRQGESHGSRKAIDVEAGDIQGTSGVFMAPEIVVDDPDDCDSYSRGSPSGFFSGICRCPIYLHPILKIFLPLPAKISMDIPIIVISRTSSVK